jgi:hypothetical protein
MMLFRNLTSLIGGWEKRDYLHSPCLNAAFLDKMLPVPCALTGQTAVIECQGSGQFWMFAGSHRLQTMGLDRIQPN